MRPIITVTAVVLVHLCVIAVLVGVNGCRSTSGFEQEGDLAAFSAGARPAGTAIAPPSGAYRIPTPEPTKLAPITRVGPGGKYTCVKGDTLASVALREKVTRAELAKANGLTLNADLKPGQVIVIPSGGAPKAPVKAGTKTGTKAAAAAPKSAPAAAAEPAPSFTPLKIISLTNPSATAEAKPADAAPAAKK